MLGVGRMMKRPHARMWVIPSFVDEPQRMMATLRGKVWYIIAKWTAPCSGCHEGCDSDPGSGCHECGHTGVRRNEHWVPLLKNDQIVLNIRRRCRIVRDRAE